MNRKEKRIPYANREYVLMRFEGCSYQLKIRSVVPERLV